MTGVPRGFVALLPVLILGTLLLTLAMTVALSAYLVRLEALEAGYAAQSRADAYACMQVALFEIAADSSYSPPEGGISVWLTQESACRIESISTQAAQRIVIVSAEHRSFRTAYELVLEDIPGSEPPFRFISFREI